MHINNVSSNLKELRRNLNLNKDQMAHLLNKSTDYYELIEDGIQKPNIKFIILLSEKLNVSMEYLLSNNNEIDIIDETHQVENVKSDIYYELDYLSKDDLELLYEIIIYFKQN